MTNEERAEQYPDPENLIRLLEGRDDEAVPVGGPTSFGAGRGVVSTDEVRSALLGATTFDGRDS